VTERFGTPKPTYELALNGDVIDLGACHAAWWRRPRPFTLHEGLAAGSEQLVYAECQEAISGLWPALDVTWVNRPELDEVAHHKPYQLAVAGEVGLAIPRTVITNDPVEARRFIHELGFERVVYKMFAASEAAWRETRVLRADELAQLSEVRLQPVIFQEFVPAECDVRVTAIGERLFATAIRTSPGGYQFDYRMELGSATMEPTQLPRDVYEKLRALMQRLGLVYGAIDLRRTSDGQHVFLEVNPAGEWLFVEQGGGQPITEAMAELLVELDRR
jgi:glutathione synthase/RimK-type ligase-like ATP-grasp enzyme